MSFMKKKLVVANWKMNPKTLDDALELFDGIKKGAAKAGNVSTVIAPTFVHLPDILLSYKGNKIDFAAQDVYYEPRGSHTGEVSVGMLKDLGVSYVIVGHSERRADGESNEDIAKKVRAVVEEGLTCILCIGERERDHNATYLSVVEEQLSSALKGIEKKHLKRLVIAYEPVWAIGKTSNNAMKAYDVHQMVVYVRKILTEQFDKKVAFSIPVLYGGSVKAENAKELMSEGEVNGFLVGGASLAAEEFSEILSTVDKL